MFGAIFSVDRPENAPRGVIGTKINIRHIGQITETAWSQWPRIDPPAIGSPKRSLMMAGHGNLYPFQVFGRCCMSGGTIGRRKTVNVRINNQGKYSPHEAAQSRGHHHRTPSGASETANPFWATFSAECRPRGHPDPNRATTKNLCGQRLTGGKASRHDALSRLLARKGC